MNISAFIEKLLNEYIRIYNASNEEAQEIKRIISVGLIPDNPLEKRDAARIIHFFLRQTKIESDEPEWDKAKKLKDLYDCHTCVDHVAQIYVKGIISVAYEDVFGMRNNITDKEAEEIINRVFNIDKRVKPD